MPSFNQVTIAGNLTREPEIRVTPSGTSICQFGLAINRKFKTEGGETKEEVCFVDLEAWGKTADLISKYLTKGDSALFVGRLKFDQWEDKTSGQKRSKLKVVVDQVTFLGKKDDSGSPKSEGWDSSKNDKTPERHTPPPANKKPAPPAPDIDEDVPF